MIAKLKLFSIKTSDSVVFNSRNKVRDIVITDRKSVNYEIVNNFWINFYLKHFKQRF